MTDGQRTQMRGAVRVGSGMLAAGGLMAILIFGDRNGFLDGFLPRIWSQTRVSHLPISVILFLVGGRLLWGVRDSARTADASTPVVFHSVRFITRRECPLCDEALRELERFESRMPQIEIVDVDSDPMLQSLYSNCVPVVVFDGKVRFRGHVDPMLLRRLLDAQSSKSLAGTATRPIENSPVEACPSERHQRRDSAGKE